MPMQVMGPPSDAARAAALPDAVEVLAWHFKEATRAVQSSDNHNQQPGSAPRAGASTADVVPALSALRALARPSLIRDLLGQRSDGAPMVCNCVFSGLA